MCKFSFVNLNGPIKVNQKMAFLGLKFGNLEKKSICLCQKLGIENRVLKPKFQNPNSRFLSQRVTEIKVQNPGLTAESCTKPKINNQQFLRKPAIEI